MAFYPYMNGEGQRIGSTINVEDYFDTEGSLLIDKVIDSIEEWQLPAPDFRNGEKRFSAILFSQQSFDKMSRNDRIRACYQHCCLKYVTGEQMTNHSLRERFNLNEYKAHSASRIIKDTLDAKMIKIDDPESSSKRYSKYIPYWA